MKKLFLMVLTLMVLCMPLAAMTEEAAPETVLPFGLSFGMDLETVAQLAGEDAQVEAWDEDNGDGSVFLDGVPLGIGSIQAGYVSMNITTNNSAREARLDSISASILFEGNCIAAFRSTLADLTAVYGEPDSDPFDQYARESYQEFGNLSASWTTPTTRIYLSLNQAYTESGFIDISFSHRLCYDLSDLDV